MSDSIGRHFTLQEFTVSALASRLGRDVDQVPQEYLGNLERLVDTCLDPLRERLGRPIVITSGYRPLWLNKLVGGSPTSAHVEGRAADLIVPGVPLLEICKACDELALPFDQVILEFPPTGWVHIGIAHVDAAPRRQRLTALKVSGRTRYFPGHLQEAA